MTTNAEITLAMVQELRDRTGVGIGDCKKALVEAAGDMDEAITILRKKGMASAAKKQGREANEGVVTSAENAKFIALVEVNAETDFVVQNDKFQEFAASVAQEAADTEPASVEAFLTQRYSKEPSMTIDEYRGSIIQMIGENIQISRIELLPKSSDSSIGIYSHLGGKIIVAVTLQGASGEEALAKDIAMHVAAASPEYLSPETVPADKIAHEKEIVESQISGKPDNIKEKIIDGKIQTYYKEACLTEQPYIRDDKCTVKQLVEARSKEIQKPLALTGFIRWSVGE